MAHVYLNHGDRLSQRPLYGVSLYKMPNLQINGDSVLRNASFVALKRSLSQPERVEQDMVSPQIFRPDDDSVIALREIIKSLEKANNINEAYLVLSKATKDKGFKELSNVLFEFKGFYFDLILDAYAEEYAEKLKRVNELGLESAPILIDYKKISDFEALIITYYPGCEEQSPIPYYVAKHRVSDDIKLQFISEMKTLADNDLVHTYVSHLTRNLFINPTTNKLLLKRWDLLKEVSSPFERENTLRAIRLALRTQSSEKPL